MKNILLLEPGYKNKYPPLGLMKIAQYHRQQKTKRNIVFAKGEKDPKLTSYKWDRIYITTLFSFEWRRTEIMIDKAIQLVNGEKSKIYVGGISASLMPEEYQAVKKWQGIHFIKGILKDTPTVSLGLGYNDLGGRTLGGTPIDEMTPDYSILEQVDYQYPVHDAYFGYASRGCVRKCKFCGVPKLEGDQVDMPPISQLVNSIDKLYGTKKDLVLMDNNVTAAPKFKEIVAEIRDLGITPGSKLKRNGYYYKRRVDFNQGVDARLLSKNPVLLKELSTISISPLRIAFDHLGTRKVYERSVREAAANGITSLSNYMLYNFHDSPEDLYKRLVINIELNQELGIRIWSFPMRYQPVTFKKRSFVGEKWNKYFLRSFQVILQATHVVSGNPSFFGFAFGHTLDEFMNLLAMPHEFIFNRDFYFINEGRTVLDDFIASWNSLSSTKREALMSILSGPTEQLGLRPSLYKEVLLDQTIDPEIRKIMRFYATYYQVDRTSKDKLFSHKDLEVPVDEMVEDPGLFDKYESTNHSVNEPVPSSIKQIDLFENPAREIRVANS